MSYPVHKFGGAAVADAKAIRRVVEILRAESVTPVVVVSALAGITDALLGVLDQAAAGAAAEASSALHALAQRHRTVARALLTGARRSQALMVIDAAFEDVDGLVRALAVLRECTPRTRDHVLATGERLSAQLVALALMETRRRARYVDAITLVHTDGIFGSATPDLEATRRAARRALLPLAKRGTVVVVPGFIGAGPDGTTVTLGRGGSDLSATTLAAAIHAPTVTLWKDVPGLLTADPRVVPEARIIPQVHVREAAELAYYGAKVLHPRALVPIAGKRTPVYIRPFADPSAPGSEISARKMATHLPVKAVSVMGAQAMITVEGNGMLGVPGIAARSFAALHRAGISVSMISQASSEHSLCFTVPDAAAAEAQRRVAEEFVAERGRREIDGVTMQRGYATLAVVGLGMAGAKGVAARIFAALRKAAVNVVAIAQGSSELNISVVVDAAHAGAAQRAIHRAFLLDKVGGGAVGEPARRDLVLLGFGQIGRRVSLLAAAARRDRVELRVVGVIDRSGVVFDPKGLSPARLRTLVSGKAAGKPLASAKGGRNLPPAEAVRWIADHALHTPILADVTAGDTAPIVRDSLLAGMAVVLANKKPLTGPIAQMDELLALADHNGRPLRRETTVGAGLPILDTFDKLVESGDRVRRIDGCLSGTLGFLFDQLSRGTSFSEALQAALALGYTEPDPRDDLSGMDVARKALSLARLLGYRGELADVAIESLVPADATRMPVDRFLANLPRYNAAWATRIAAAAAKGRVLRYVASASARGVRVGLQEVDATSPFFGLRGTDNQVVFVTDRYRERPLVITGPGAGPDVTAAGVMNDVLALARVGA